LSFQDSFSDDLDKDSGTMAFMHFQRSIFVLYLGASYEKAMAYTNLIVVAGYAGFFALWQITKDYLSRN